MVAAIPLNYRWLVAPEHPDLAARLCQELGLSPLLARCLVNRGFAHPSVVAGFLAPRLKDVGDPLLVPGMAQAVERLWRARETKEPLVVFGDYDVDGVTATALLLEIFGPLGWTATYYLPHRLDEGYGLTPEAVETCLQKNPVKLLLAVDCGSTSREAIQRMQERGVDVIVLDHHQIASPPPEPVALVNPQLGGENGPLRELCSVGLAFKLAHALVRKARAMSLPEAAHFDLRPLLDLVALGTIADLVPITGENRILVAAGLERLNRLERPGLRALCSVAQIPGSIWPFEVGYQLSPRLNAAGRLETASEALEVVLTRDPARARALAASLDQRNRERQNIERSIAEEVVELIRARFNPSADYVLVEGHLLWHVGVVGIVASRVLHEFYRPAIILGGDGHAWRGSGRSIDGFDLAAALRQCQDLLLRHGGHAMAAGVTIDPEKVPALRARLNAMAKQNLCADQLRPPLRLDAEVGLAELTLSRMEELERLAPGGQGNPPVQVVVRGLRHERPPQRMGRERQHVKFWVSDGRLSCETVWWNGGGKPWPDGAFDLACAPRVNQFNGRTNIQLRLLDWRPVGAA